MNQRDLLVGGLGMAFVDDDTFTTAPLLIIPSLVKKEPEAADARIYLARLSYSVPTKHTQKHQQAVSDKDGLISAKRSPFLHFVVS